MNNSGFVGLPGFHSGDVEDLRDVRTKIQQERSRGSSANGRRHRKIFL